MAEKDDKIGKAIGKVISKQHDGYLPEPRYDMIPRKKLSDPNKGGELDTIKSIKPEDLPTVKSLDWRN